MTHPSVTDRDLLHFEATVWYRHAGAKEAAVRERFGLSGVEYARRLWLIVSEPDPGLVVEFGATLARLGRRLDAGLAARLPRSA